MNAADGSGRENLTSTSAFIEETPVFSPDGTKIAFAKTTAERREVDLYTMNVDGTGVQQLTDFPGREYNPDWSPDGRKLVFTKFRTANGTRLTRLIVMRVDGTSRRTLLEGSGVGSPVWSPNGGKVAFEDLDQNDVWDIYTVKSDGTGKTSVTTTQTTNENFPDWGVKTP
jgi:Tol biopolymer transport system component